MDSRQMLKMSINDSCDVGGVSIMRVPGGLIYTFTKKMHCEAVGQQIVMSSAFVPLDINIMEQEEHLDASYRANKKSV